MGKLKYSLYKDLTKKEEDRPAHIYMQERPSRPSESAVELQISRVFKEAVEDGRLTEQEADLRIFKIEYFDTRGDRYSY